jgi:hypothetical protein
MLNGREIDASVIMVLGAVSMKTSDAASPVPLADGNMICPVTIPGTLPNVLTMEKSTVNAWLGAEARTAERAVTIHSSLFMLTS